MGLNLSYLNKDYYLKPIQDKLTAERHVAHEISGFVFCSGTQANLVTETTTALTGKQIQLTTSVVPAQGSFVRSRGDNLEMGTVAFRVAGTQAPCPRCTQYRGSCPGTSQDHMSLTHDADLPNRGAQVNFTVNVNDAFDPSEAECLRLPSSS